MDRNKFSLEKREILEGDMLGTKNLISNIDVEVKRRKILALTPPPDVFLSNSNQFNDHNKGLDFPSNAFCKNDMPSSISSSLISIQQMGNHFVGNKWQRHPMYANS